MSEEQTISEMWRVFGEGLGGDCGHLGKLNIDWYTIGCVHQLRLRSNFSLEVYELSYYMLDFGRKIGLEG